MGCGEPGGEGKGGGGPAVETQHSGTTRTTGGAVRSPRVGQGPPGGLPGRIGCGSFVHHGEQIARISQGAPENGRPETCRTRNPRRRKRKGRGRFGVFPPRRLGKGAFFRGADFPASLALLVFSVRRLCPPRRASRELVGKGGTSRPAGRAQCAPGRRPFFPVRRFSAGAQGSSIRSW